MTGILSICSLDAHVLFDPGFMYSYVSPMFAKNFTKERIDLERPFLVATPTGETILVRDGYRSCNVAVGELETVADLMLLDMTDFDVILGMDWLASCHVTLYCLEKSVKFGLLGNPVFVF